MTEPWRRLTSKPLMPRRVHSYGDAGDQAHAMRLVASMEWRMRLTERLAAWMARNWTDATWQRRNRARCLYSRLWADAMVLRLAVPTLEIEGLERKLGSFSDV